MNSRLILVRHGEAESYANKPYDADRELTERGRQQAISIAAQIANVYKVDYIVTSPYLRARQTAQPLIDAFSGMPFALCEYLTPDNSPHQAIEWLSLQSAQCMAVVCHMPIVSRIVALLTDDDAESFALAEFRVLEQPQLILGLSRQIACGSPPF